MEGCISGQTQGSAPTIFFASITRLVTCMGGTSGQAQGPAPATLFATNCPDTPPLSAIKNNAER